MDFVDNFLTSLKREKRYRRLQAGEGAIDFASNDYLGLTQNPRLRAELIAALGAGCPLGAGGSRLLSGETSFHIETEMELANHYHRESALLFGSGYAANIGVIGALAHAAREMEIETTVFSDQLNHASLIDGIRLARCRYEVFHHNDMDHLGQLLAQNRSGQKIIATESVFSMDGDLAPLGEIFHLARRYNAFVVVDEAHATGVFGPTGRGRLEEIENADPSIALIPHVQVHTCGKALGAMGAFVLSSLSVRELMINSSRSFLFSTALTPLTAVHIRAAVRLLGENPGKGARLLATAADFRLALADFANTGRSASQIVPVILGDSEAALRLAEFVRERGYDVRAIRSPTVAKGTERLRLSLNSTHTPAQLAGLVEALRAGMRAQNA